MAIPVFLVPRLLVLSYYRVVPKQSESNRLYSHSLSLSSLLPIPHLGGHTCNTGSLSSLLLFELSFELFSGSHPKTSISLQRNSDA